MRGCFFVIAAVLTLPIPVARADDTTKSPDATAPTTKPEADHAAHALRVARTLLRALGDSNYKSAYELMAPPYREANSREQFGELAAALRKRVDLSRPALPPVDGWVLVNPEAGQARRAAFTLGTRRGDTAINPATPAKSSLGVRVVQQPDGRWLVTEVRAIDPNRERMTFTEPVMDAARLGSDVRHITSTITGVVTAVKDDSVTIRPDPRADNPSLQPPDRTLKLDERAEVVRVRVSITDTRSPRGRGRTTLETITAPGTLADLTPGVRVTVEPSADDERAAGVEVSVDSGL